MRLEYQRKQQVLRQSETETLSAERLKYQREHQELPRQSETEAQSAERLKHKREHHGILRQSETENELMVRLKSRTLLYETSKTLQSKRYLNFARSQISSEVSDGLVDEHSIGSVSYSCSICDAKFWESEKFSTSTKACIKFSLCCGEGKVVLPTLDKLPELLGHLLTATNSRGKYFRDHIRAYNSSLVHLDQISTKSLVMLDVVYIPSVFRALCIITLEVWVQIVMRHQFLPRSTFTTELQRMKWKTVRDI